MDIAYNKTDGVVLPITNTRISASEYNQIAASLMQIITSAGLTPDAANNVQLLNALKAMGSGWSMPSNTYNDLTLGASGSTYTAPANGWFVVGKVAGATGLYWYWENQTASGIRYSLTSQNGNQVIETFLPCKKGDTIFVSYNLSGTTNVFRFIYAEGAK